MPRVSESHLYGSRRHGLDATLSGRRRGGKLRGLPRRKTADQVGQPRKAVAFQETHGNGRPVAAGTGRHHRAVAGDVGEALFQMVERNITTTLDVFLLPLA